MMIFDLLNYLIQKEDYSLNFLVTQTHYALELQAIVNHTSIGEYQLNFFSQEEFKCLCELYPIETCHHILHEYKRYKNYWNLRHDTIGHFTFFLEFNRNAFSFGDSIT